MVRFLLARPIAVLMTFLALMVFSVIVFRTLPISLLPPIDVPQIVIKVNYPNASPEAIEQNVLRGIRDELMTLNGLEDMESKSGSEVGTIRLTFDYGTKMELAYIDVNEKIDRITNSLPSDLDRPQVIRINTNDIPVARVQVVPKEGIDYTEVSLLAENVLKKRLEQLQGVSLVDINGKKERSITVTPNKPALRALGMTEENVIRAIQFGNEELPGISVEDGQFRYYLRLATRVDTPDDIMRLPVTNQDGLTVDLGRVAEVKYENKDVLGYHYFGTKEGLVITVHKQASAKMNEMMPLIYESLEYFKNDYPQVDFELTQDQSTLLNAGISNLQTSLLFGGLFAFGVLFLFMGNYRTPVIIGISLPSSLIISFLVFYFFDISINVISLSGLALGLGMLIDNSIIVLDNITRKRKEGLAIFEACVEGVNEVMSALISSVLTTLAVFIPLIFLSGISGALFYDQAVSVAAILFVSLLVAFILLPMLYHFFFHNKSAEELAKEDSKFFGVVLRGYKRLYQIIFKKRGLSFVIFLVFIPLALLVSQLLKTEGLPPIEKFDALVEIDWNEPIGVEQNRDRLIAMLESLDGDYLKAESDVGVRQFLLFDGENSIQQASVYFLFETQEKKTVEMDRFRKILEENYAEANINIMDAPNAFDQLFSSNLSYYEVRWKDLTTKRPVEEAKMDTWLATFPVQDFERGPGLQKEASVIFRLDGAKMALYGISSSAVQEQIQKLFGTFPITEIKRFGEITPIRMKGERSDFEQILRTSNIIGKDGNEYALSNFINFDYENHYKYVTADKGGIYQSVLLNEENPTQFDREISLWGSDKNLGVSFFGQYFKDRETISQLVSILMIAVLLLYFILSAQFESFVQPLIVIFTLPLGIGGAFIVLLLTGTSLNVMSAIGLVVMLGIMVNDAILKIDTVNRLRIRYSENTNMDPKAILDRALYEAGEIRLKPILMTSITTILALLPVVFSSGLGADLQRPLVFSVIGGLTIGTFTALYFVPLAYWFIGGKVSIKEKE
ncbi:efflux RND transporter permease subunit [Belliella aquatica]|uniref:Cation transporter n=1 Tax=Belliella aquatica TaxID=1323734 RepID=A0ABQ1MQG8_9BACT|nr:efflux RND transporter permease subunit [Belliella aquatica]MCH7406190.1 efflux RND transporter permease subunit [Belliella aquatica]GGC44536.1 cation transporter [Belliella aquatica]